MQMVAKTVQTAAQEKAAIDKATKAALALADKDLAAPLHVFHGFLPQAVRDVAKSCCKDEVDAPIAILCFELVVACLASASVVVATNAHWASLVAHFAILYVLYAERYILMLHFSEHRRVYKHKWMDQIAPSFIAPFFGIPPFLYRLHHVYMHHVENNGVGDLSSTEDYTRSNISEFVRYWVRFWAAAWVSLPFWASRNKRQDVLMQALPYLAAWAVALTVLPVNALCFRWLFVVTHCVTFFLLAFGNWSQHVFVNPDTHRTNPGLAYDVVGSDFNQRVFNDGYHLVHHAHSRAHWSDLPNRFKAGIDHRRETDALAFHSIDFFMVGVYGTWWPGLGGLRRLARDHYVFFGQPSAKLSNCKCSTPEVVDNAYCVNCVVKELDRRRVAIKPKTA